MDLTPEMLRVAVAKVPGVSFREADRRIRYPQSDVPSGTSRYPSGRVRRAARRARVGYGEGLGEECPDLQGYVRREREETVVEQADVVVVGARLAGCAVRAACPRGPEGGRAGQDELPVGSALHPRADARRHQRAREARRASANPGAEPVQDPVDHGRGRGHVGTERLRPAPDGTDFGLCVLATCRTYASSKPSASRAARSMSGARSRRCTGAPAAWRAFATPTKTEQHDISARLWWGPTADARASPRSRRLEPLSGFAQRPRPGVSLPGRSPAGTRAAETYIQWREGESFAFAFPTAPEGRLLILLMGHRDEVGDARKDPEGHGGASSTSTAASPSGSPAWTRAPARNCGRRAKHRPSSVPRPDRAGRSPATPGTSRTP